MRHGSRRPALAASLTAALLSIAGAEATAQMSRIYEFGPDATELAPTRPPMRTGPGSVPIDAASAGGAPCVLLSPRELRVPPPPDDRATTRELRELRKLSAGDDPVRLAIIRHWDTGFPSAPWHARLADVAVDDSVGSAERARLGALLDVAIHDALIAAWDSKLAHRRPRPDELDGRLDPEVIVPAAPSYPSEHAVVAGAAAGILGWIFPAHADRLSVSAEEAAWSRVAAGAAFPSDARAGLALGRAVARRVIAGVPDIADATRPCVHGPVMAAAVRHTPSALEDDQALLSGPRVGGDLRDSLDVDGGRRGAAPVQQPLELPADLFVQVVIPGVDDAHAVGP